MSTDIRCAICGGETDGFSFARFGWPFHECRQCGFIRRDPSTHLPLDLQKPRYDQHINRVGDARYEQWFRPFVADFVLPFATGRGLDYGSGPEPVLQQLLLRGYGLALDIYDPIYAKHDDTLARQYGFITLTEVAEHFTDPVADFARLAALLAPGGHLLVKTSFHPADRARFLNWHYMRDETHVGFYTPRAFAALADRLPLDLLKLDQRGHACFKKQHP